MPFGAAPLFNRILEDTGRVVQPNSSPGMTCAALIQWRSRLSRPEMAGIMRSGHVGANEICRLGCGEPQPEVAIFHPAAAPEIPPFVDKTKRAWEDRKSTRPNSSHGYTSY